MTQIVFIVGLLSQPRCIKRVESIRKAGYKCVVYGYNRGKYDCNTYSPEVELHVFSQQTLQDGADYISKCICYFRDIYSVVKKYPRASTVYYAFGLFSALMLAIFHRKYIYEISDVLYGYPKFNIVRPILKFIDKILIKRSELTVMTSEGFYNYYGVNKSNIIVQPNKPDRHFVDVNRDVLSLSKSSFKFGFVGAIRYDSVFRFAEVIGQKFSDSEFHFYGGSSHEVVDRCNELSAKYLNVFYHGKFKNPEDLQGIYSNLDIVVASYDTASLNEKIAEPNKLYEAMLFCRPIIVSSNTFLATQVEKMRCGYIIDPSNTMNIEYFVSRLSKDDVNSISARERDIPISELIDDPDRIISCLSEII